MILNNKEFKAIPGYTGYYASKDGEIYSEKKTGRVLRQFMLGCCKYKVVQPTINGKAHNIPVHKLVALAWCQLPDGYTTKDVLGNYISRTLTVDHIDGDKLNNTADNLRWCTVMENVNYNNWDKESRSKKLLGNQNAKGRNLGNKYAEGRNTTSHTYRYTYKYNGKEYGIKELCQELNCSKSKITESFRRNLGLVKLGLLTREVYVKGE